jgi:hypothetical protein
MDNEKVKVLVKEMLEKGLSLGEILKELDSRHGISMTFMELKFLASEIDYDWSKPEPEAEESTEEENAEPENNNEGCTVVEVNRLARPGAVLHGSVQFASGAKGEWVLDQFGRLGFENLQGEPTPEDIEDFKLELQKSIGA